MKKKIQQILLTSLLFVFSILIISIPTQAAKPAATTVKSKTSYSNSKESMTVRGLDAKKTVVWKYVTKKYTATELPRTKCIVRKDKVYVFESSKIVVLRKKDGKQLWTAKKVSPAGHRNIRNSRHTKNPSGSIGTCKPRCTAHSAVNRKRTLYLCRCQ